jgi:serine/threonine protein kinase
MNPEQDLTGRRVGRYELRSFLGRGGMGAVYRAYDANLDRHVAVKILPPHLVTDADRVRRFVQEAKSASALNHPHVISIYDIGQDESIHYIAMELVEGATLRDRIGGSAMELKRALVIGEEIAEAIGAAHDAGVVHRDLKPENVIIASPGYVKVLDFGLAKLQRESSDVVVPDEATHVRSSTEPGKIMGTAGYMSPEQAEGKPVDHRSDIFSLGCILYEMVSGRAPFRGRSTIDTIHNIIHAEPPPLRELPPEMQRIVAKALAKSPDDRYQSAKDLAVDLRRLLRELDSNTSHASDYGYTPSRSRTRRGLAIGGAMLAIIAGAALVLKRPRDAAQTTAAAPAAQLKIQRLTSTGDVIAAALSPDGKYIAYVTSQDGQQALWLRQIASRQDLELVSPADGSFWGHTFARDGNSIYYVLKSRTTPRGALYSISTLGGRSVKILEDIESTVAFSPDGKQIAFVRLGEHGASALVTAKADGSGARELMTRRPPESLGPIFFTGPSWSPDGKRIAVSVASRNKKDGGSIVEADVATGSVREISAGWQASQQVAWMPDGNELVAVGTRGTPSRDRQLWRVPYPAGEPRRITNDLLDYRIASLSGDGSMLVTVASDLDADLWLVPPQPDAPRKLRSGKAVGVLGISVAPDGSLAYVSLDSGNPDVWTTDVSGTNARQLTNDANSETSTRFIDNGTAVLFTQFSSETGVRRIAADGSAGGATGLFASAWDLLSVSRDGSTMVFAGDDGLMKAPVDGGTPSRLTTYVATRPAISPAATRVACYCQLNANDPMRLCIVPMSGGAPLRMLDLPAATFSSMIDWTDDGQSVIVNTMPNDRRNLWRVPLDGGEPERLTNFDDLLLFHFAYTPGRKGFVVSRGEVTRDAMLISGLR